MRELLAAAAVERAEKQRDMVFESWAISEPRISAYEWESCKLTWNAAQQAERERIKNIVAGLLDPIDPWIHYSTLLEKIDDV